MKSCFIIFLFHVRESSKAVLDSGFHALDSGFQVLNSGIFVIGTRILDLNHYWDSGLFDSKARGSEASRGQPRENWGLPLAKSCRPLNRPTKKGLLGAKIFFGTQIPQAKI